MSGEDRPDDAEAGNVAGNEAGNVAGNEAGSEAGRDSDRGAISWESLAAELAATRELAEERGEADPSTWDTVAAELAARVAERPVEGAPQLVVVPDDEVETAPTGGVDAGGNDPTGAATAGEPEPVAVDEPPTRLDPEALRGGLEALLFVMDDPVDEETLAAALRCPVDQVPGGLAELAEGYDRRRAGIVLRRVGEGWRLYTREEHAGAVERWLGEGQHRALSQAALETLAVIAYRQPVTRAQVSAIRGVGVDGVMRTLLGRGLVHETGSDPDTGGGRYGTTPLFLERLGLRGLDELPELAPLLPEPASLLDEHPDT